MKGCYCLIIKNDKTAKIRVGKLGEKQFPQGHYVYVGSAMNSLESRIKRHISSDKKLHWHIDYLLKKTEITNIIYNESSRKIECDLSQYISAKAPGIKDFGCSDCDCESHLYYFKNEKDTIKQVKNAYDSMAMKYQFFKI